MITKTQKNLVQWAVEYALKNGCQGCRASLAAGTSNSFQIRDMNIDILQQASSNSLSIVLFVDGRYGGFSTNRLYKDEIASLIENSIESTRYIAEDRARTLPNQDLYYKGGMPDLQQYDHKIETINIDEKIDLAMGLCGEIVGKDSRIVSAESGWSDSESFTYTVASNGFEGETAATNFSLYGYTTVRGEGDARPSDYWQENSLFYDDLKKQGIGSKALEKALSKIGQKKIGSAQMPMLLDFRVSETVLDPVVSALYGSAIQQQNSFLIDKLGNKVFGENITITDDPHLIKTSGARYFDSEGVATYPRTIIDRGVLNTYFIDTYYGNKLGMAGTINSPSVINMNMGKRDAAAIIADIDRAIYVTGFNGGNSNSTTGDFSYGIEGFLIENGKIVCPISEMNITGNFITLWNNLLEAGNDANLSWSWRIPSLLFDGVSFSGF